MHDVWQAPTVSSYDLNNHSRNTNAEVPLSELRFPKWLLLGDTPR